MKVTKAQSLENRARIVETASVLFREKGYDGVSVADLMVAAGLTHGGFYKHFASKADLMVESTARGLAAKMDEYQGLAVADVVSRYLSREHRDGRGDGCTMAALCGDAARQTAAVQAAFESGIADTLSAVERGAFWRHRAAVADAWGGRPVPGLSGRLAACRRDPRGLPPATDGGPCACTQALILHKGIQ